MLLIIFKNSSVITYSYLTIIKFYLDIIHVINLILFSSYFSNFISTKLIFVASQSFKLTLLIIDDLVIWFSLLISFVIWVCLFITIDYFFLPSSVNLMTIILSIDLINY